MKVARIYVFGDSLVTGTYDSQGGWCDRLKQDMHRITVDATDGTKRQMYNLGIGGETSKGLAGRITAEIIARHRPEWPAIVIIGIGTNDSRLTNNIPAVSLDEYEKNLETIIAAARKVTDKVFMVGLGPCAEETINFKKFIYTRESLKAYETKLTEVAARLNVQKVTVYDKLAASDPKQIFYRDGLHLSDQGYILLYEAVKPVLMRYLDEE